MKKKTIQDSFARLAKETSKLNLYQVSGVLVKTTYKSRANFTGDLCILMDDGDDVVIEDIIFPVTVCKAFKDIFNRTIGKNQTIFKTVHQRVE